MFDNLPAGFALIKSSWNVLRTDKKLLLFPMISGVACLLVLATFVLPFALHPEWLKFAREIHEVDDEEVITQVVPLWIYGVFFAYYVVNYFVIVFCNAALISCALIRFNGGEPTLKDGFDAALNRLPQILGWAILSATIGVILKAIENTHERVGEFISGILGTAWTVITYFVVPVLVVEKVNPFQAVSRSLDLLHKTWGTALVGKLGIGFVLALLMIPGVVGVMAGFMLAAQHGVLGLAVAGLGIVYLIGWMAASSALNGIFVGALYQYAAFGEVPNGFDRGDMDRAFAGKAPNHF